MMDKAADGFFERAVRIELFVMQDLYDLVEKQGLQHRDDTQEKIFYKKIPGIIMIQCGQIGLLPEPEHLTAGSNKTPIALQTKAPASIQRPTNITQETISNRSRMFFLPDPVFMA